MILSRFRILTQATSAILANSYVAAFYTRAVNANPLKGVCVPVLNCYACPTALFACPIGTLQHFAAIHTFPYYPLAFMVLIGLLIGRMACGWACPFGLLQDLMYKIKSPKYKAPSWLKHLKFPVLFIFVFALPYLTGDLWFSKLCPAGTLTAGIPWVLWNPVNPTTGMPVLPNGPGMIFYLCLVILAGFLVWFVLTRRPFCKGFCPMGAIFSVFNRFSIFHLHVKEGCDGCQTCKDNCPMDLDVSLDADSGDCIRCLECTKCGHVKLVTPFSHEENVRWEKQ
jgi:ferredoxin-type protein NapH